MSPIMPKLIDKVNHKDGVLDGAVAAEDLLEQVHRLMHLLRSRQFQDLRTGPHPDLAITRMEAKVLGFFSRHAGATQSDLASHSGRDKAQLARLIKGLRDQGLLEAQADAADRRNLRLTLSAQGLALQRALSQQARKLSVQAVAGLSAEECLQMQTLLQRMCSNLDPEH